MDGGLGHSVVLVHRWAPHYPHSDVAAKLVCSTPSQHLLGRRWTLSQLRLKVFGAS